MKYLTLLIPSFFLIFMTGCTNKNKVTAEPDRIEETVEEAAPLELDWAKEGYLKATVNAGDADTPPCDFLLTVDRLGTMETNDLPEEFKVDGLEIWVKIYPQRRVSICQGTTPGDIIGIVER